MKKLFLTLPLIALMMGGFISCGTKVMKNENDIYCDFFAARDLAMKQKKELLVVFTACGEEFDNGKCEKLVENVLATEDFKNTIGKEFVVVQCDLSQKSYNKCVAAEDATSKEVKAARKNLSVYNLNMMSAQILNCHEAPGFFRLSDKGYLIGEISIKEDDFTVEKFTEKIRINDDVRNYVVAEIEGLVAGKDKDENVKKCINYCNNLKSPSIQLLDYINNYILENDVDNKNGVNDEIKKMKAEIKASKYAYQNNFKSASDVYYKLSQDKKISEAFKSDAYYNAAYFIGLSDTVKNYDVAIKYTEKAKEYTTNEENLKYYDEMIEYYQEMQRRAAKRIEEEKQAKKDAKMKKSESDTEETAESTESAAN